MNSLTQENYIRNLTSLGSYFYKKDLLDGKFTQTYNENFKFEGMYKKGMAFQGKWIWVDPNNQESTTLYKGYFNGGLPNGFLSNTHILNENKIYKMILTDKFDLCVHNKGAKQYVAIGQLDDKGEPKGFASRHFKRVMQIGIFDEGRLISGSNKLN